MPAGVNSIGRNFQRLTALRAEALVAVLTVLNLVATFGLQIAIFRTLGASRETDAYFAASAIPQVLLAITITTSSGALVPFLARLPIADRAAATRKVVVRAFGVLMVPTILLAMTASSWSTWLFSGFNDAPVALLSTRLNVAAVLCCPAIAVTAVLTGAHYARGTFVIAEAISTACNWLMVGGIVAALPQWGVMGAAYGLLIRYYVQAALLAAPAKGRANRTVSLADLWNRARPLLAGNIFLKSDMLVDRHLLSMASPGGLSLVALAQSVYAPVAGVLGQALSTTALPQLAAESVHPMRSRLFRRNFALLAVLSLLAVGAIIVAAEPLLALLTDNATKTGAEIDLWKVLVLLSGVPVFGAIGGLVAAAFYAVHDTRTPTVVSVASFSIFVIVRILAFDQVGVYALCISISCYYLTNCLILALIIVLRGARE